MIDTDLGTHWVAFSFQDSSSNTSRSLRTFLRGSFFASGGAPQARPALLSLPIKPSVPRVAKGDTLFVLDASEWEKEAAKIEKEIAINQRQRDELEEKLFFDRQKIESNLDQARLEHEASDLRLDAGLYRAPLCAVLVRGVCGWGQSDNSCAGQRREQVSFSQCCLVEPGEAMKGWRQS